MAHALVEKSQDLPQHLRSLEYANVIRIARADIKKQVAAGKRTVVEILDDPPKELDRMTLHELLRAQRRYGGRRASMVLSHVGISTTRTIGKLTERQRLALIAYLTDLKGCPGRR